MPKWTPTSKDVTEHQRKSIATARRPIYLCPLPSELFRVAPLVWLHEQCVARGVDPMSCEFFAALKRNRMYLVEYVLFGMLKDGKTVVAAKDWPEKVLIALPSEMEQIDMARREFHRYEKPTRWVTERTANRLVTSGMARWAEQGSLIMGDVRLGTYNLIKDDHIYSGPNQYTYRKPIVYPPSP